MRFIFSSGSLWSYSLERCFAFAREAGFDGLEVVADQRYETRQSDYLRDLIQRRQLPIVAIHSPFMATIPGWPEDQPRRLGESVKLAEAVGAQVVVHHLPSRIGLAWINIPGRFFPMPLPWNPEKLYRRWLDQGYSDLQDGTEVQLCIENMPAYRRFGRRWNLNYWNTPEQITRFRHITLDTTHLGTWGLEPLGVYRRLGERVAHLHLSNFDGREHLPPEKGSLNLGALLAHMVSDGYTGAVCFELQPDVLGAGDPDEQVIDRMSRSLAYCRMWAGRPTSSRDAAI